MTVREHLRSVFPSTIDKSSEVFSALIANDNGNGAIESELTDLESFMSEWYSTTDVYEQTGDFLNRTIAFFTYLERFTDETDKALKNRFSAIFKRGGDTVWGTKYNMKHVFQQYFSLANVYIVENTNDTDEDNLIEDGDIISEDTTSWTLHNATIDRKARFSKSYGLLLNSSDSYASQDVEIELNDNKCFFLHFFTKGNGSVEISRNSDGKFWNYGLKEWQSSEIGTVFSLEDWEDFNLWLKMDDSDTITVKFIGTDDGETFVDYIRLFEKQPYPSFTVISQFEGSAAVSAMALAGGREDPTKDVDSVKINASGELIYEDTAEPLGNPLRLTDDGELFSSDSSLEIKDGKLYTKDSSSSDIPAWYENADYFDQAFLTGAAAGFAMDIYNDLLQYLKAVGVKAYLEIVQKDYIEGE